MAKIQGMRVGGMNLTVGEPADPTPVGPGTPFRILVLGDFSGSGDPKPALAQRKPIRIDRDNFDAVLARLAPNFLLNGPMGSETVTFRELEDFEPDRLFSQLAVFENLRGLRARVQNPATFADAARVIQSWASAPKAPSAAPVNEPSSPSSEESPERLLEELLAQSSSRGQDLIPGQSDWERFLNKIVQPSLVERSDPRQADYAELVDEALSAQMRSVLHDPGFQTLEAAWRGLQFLVRRLETDEQLQLFLLDVSKEDLGQDLASVSDLTQTGYYHHLVERARDSEKPWAVTVGLYRFEPTAGDLALLIRLAKIAGAAGAPFLAGAREKVLGCPSLAEVPDPRDWNLDPGLQAGWQLLRTVPEARYLGLGLPRFLLRLPYGREGSPCERFPFEEQPEASSHEHFLWGNPGLACALLLGQAFTRSGWSLEPNEDREITGLPLYLFDDQGERSLKPTAEVYLKETALEKIVDAGLMVLLSQRDRDAVRLARFQSLAEPAADLGGRWQE